MAFLESVVEMEFIDDKQNLFFYYGFLKLT